MAALRRSPALAFVAGALLVGAVWGGHRWITGEGTATSEPAVIPWVVFAGTKKKQGVFRVSYTTGSARPTVILHAADAAPLEALTQSSEAKERARAGDDAWFAARDATLRVYRGLPAGRPDGVGEEAYLSTLHRQEFRLDPGATFHYAVFDGEDFAGPFAFRLPAEKSFRAAHVGHTCSLHDRKHGRWRYYPERNRETLARFDPSLLLHSGDLFINTWDWARMRRETLDVFGALVPRMPLLISGSNHDLGWPQKNGSLAPELFRYLFPFPYEGDSVDFRVDYGGFRFVVIDYLELRKEPRAGRLEERILRWTGETKRPVVILWGGSKRSLWDRLAGITKQRPNVRLVLGGDGGHYAKRALDHGAWMIHNQTFWLITLEFGPDKIALRTLHEDEVLDQLEIATRPPD